MSINNDLLSALKGLINVLREEDIVLKHSVNRRFLDAKQAVTRAEQIERAAAPFDKWLGGFIADGVTVTIK